MGFLSKGIRRCVDTPAVFHILKRIHECNNKGLIEYEDLEDTFLKLNSKGYNFTKVIVSLEGYKASELRYGLIDLHIYSIAFLLDEKGEKNFDGNKIRIPRIGLDYINETLDKELPEWEGTIKFNKYSKTLDKILKKVLKKKRMQR